VAGTTGGNAASAAKKPIIIGGAVDLSGIMKPFDSAALLAAKLRAAQINAKGGVNGRKLKVIQCDTKIVNPPSSQAKACAQKLLSQGAVALLVTCDVEFAAPATQEAIKRGKLALGSCIGTDEQGPKRFGSKGRLAFSFGNVAQDEGAAMAEYAVKKKKWEEGDRRHRQVARLLQGRHRGLQAAFQGARRQGRPRRQLRPGPEPGPGPRQPHPRHEGRAGDRHLDDVRRLACARAGPQEPPREHPADELLGRRRHELVPEEPEGHEVLVRHLRIDLRRRSQPCGSQAVQPDQGQAGQAGTGSFVTGATAIDALVKAIKEAKGSTTASLWPRSSSSSRALPTISGKISFSRKFHTVFGRPYRVIEVENNKGQVRREHLGRQAGHHRLVRRCPEAVPKQRWPGSLRATAVSRAFEGVHALDEVTLELRRHEVVGLIGPNGAGKTTLVNVMSGFDAPTAGRVELDEQDVTRWTPC
jgi:ABC-type branched-subunit amino acid transport system substrate-binding protein